MEKLEVRFKDVKDVNKFVHLVSKYDSDIDLYCGSYCVDAKSYEETVQKFIHKVMSDTE